MALTEPIDLLPDFPGWTTEFDPQFRDEMSRSADGRMRVAELGPPLWRMSVRSKPLRPNALDAWRARLQWLQNGKRTFYGYALSRTYPILYPNGSWPTGLSFNGRSAQLYSVGASRYLIRVSNLPAAYQLSVGDMIQIGSTDLHRVMELAVASGGGLTPEFAVEPALWPGVDDSSPLPAVSVYRPSCIMAIVPGSISTPSDISGGGSISFQAIEARS